MVEIFANSGDPDQMPHSAVSDLSLHCLPITLLGSPDYNGLNCCLPPPAFDTTNMKSRPPNPQSALKLNQNDTS